VPAGAIVVALVVAVSGTPVWSRENGTTVSWRPQWDVAAPDRRAAKRLLEMTDRGDVVLAPESVSAAIAIQSVDVRTVNPRLRYLTRRATRSFHRLERILLSFSVTNGLDPPSAGAFVASLDLLSVDAVCTRPALDTDPVTEALRTAGWVEAGRSEECTFWVPQRDG
jgi:hypothetical protein